ncbi:ATP-dependent DNA ligase [Nitriliruptor alkaliphilus]|uniref:ATP-dependent DNA ligase n=1 Tax=Nitriliruptor alkaliphilus TaxID=427918 RepID=UPI000696339D|nr:ATP-dependent DNA ligase [Nitriliruptor alkaliphilus]
MQLSEVVEVSREVGATRSRKAKIAALAAVLARAEVDLLPVVVSFLSGEPRQDRLELGPAAVFGAEAPPAATPSLTVAEVDDALQQIADTPAGTGSRTARIRLLTEVLERATADEQDWLRRLVVRDLRQGALAGVLTAAIAQAAAVPEAAVRRAAMLSGDLRVTAAAAMTGGEAALTAFRLEVGCALEPMLASTATSVTEALTETTAAADGHGGVVVEAKLDGARVQVHRDGDRVLIFTRNLNEVAHRMPEVVDAALGLPVSSVVLDGEALALDDEGRPRRFQDTMARIGRERVPAGGSPEEVPLSVRFFDCLHLDGEDVLDRPLRERLDALARAVPAPLRVEALTTDDPADAEAFLQRTLAAGHEGVMVKALDAPYEAGRRGASWRKVKPVHTLDLVVLAAEWGSGRRRRWLSNLHLGARAEPGDPVDVEGPDGGFTMLGKTFKGLTDATLTWQTAALLEREVRREQHVVHVRPELVVEIALDGFVRSTRYAGGIALRFARVRGYREDKGTAQADTLATARAIFSGQRPPGA